MRHLLNRTIARVLSAASILLTASHASADAPASQPSHLLDVGTAGHAFDHLSGFADQGDTAAASGATIIYATGCGIWGYQGLPTAEIFNRTNADFTAYVGRVRKEGIQLVIGYICATSIVNLDRFDKNWSPEFKAKFSKAPAQWLQQDREGKPLPSWYGGEYHPACMNNPDWITYEKAIVRSQLESGCDGIFFDNPTMHPQGCYCEHCMKRFAAFLHESGTSLSELRKSAVAHPIEFTQFRSTIARDFMAEIRTYARTIKPAALITCNNSLNSPNVLFSQAQTYGYNIHEMSKTEDLVVVEDMQSQPRSLPGGAVVEYGSMYEILHAISHDKPIVAVTIAEGDYHTPGNLARLAMAEAAAHGASYLSWPTWPENVRRKMIASLKPEADLLRENANLLNHCTPRADVVVFLPWRNWTKTADCAPARSAATLTANNIQYRVVCEDDFVATLQTPATRPQMVVVESPGSLTPAEHAALMDFKKGGGRFVSSDDELWLSPIRCV